MQNSRNIVNGPESNN